MTQTMNLNAPLPKMAVNGKRSSDWLLPVAAERVDYDPVTGYFTWRSNIGARIKRGQRAGRLDRGGYVVIGVDRRVVLAHRLAYFIVHRHCPSVIDHANGVTHDNRIENLRDATPTENQRNAKVRLDNPLGIRGVTIWRDANGKHWYRAQIREGGKVAFLGAFRDPIAAWVARVAAAERIHGHEFMRESSASGMAPELIGLANDVIRERHSRQLRPRYVDAPPPQCSLLPWRPVRRETDK